MRYFPLAAWIFLLQGMSWATPESKPERAFDAHRMEHFRSLPEFAYDAPRFSASDLLNQLISQLWDKFFEYVFRAVNTKPGEIAIYVLALGALLYLLRHVFGDRMNSLLYQPARKNARDGVTAEEDPRAVNLDALLEESIRNLRWREAVRILYLLALRRLVENKKVTWRNGKTNGEYCRELNAPLRAPFADVTRVFEYLYYGDFAIDRASFDNINRKFQEFHSLAGGVH
ncbi:MAG TPA: DUF4129 domain-containing protein [Bacteroidota bacterium]|jgi:hypothetical protein|nr:DUF4129 domain-containing protein [Bacteroidota bacterium]